MLFVNNNHNGLNGNNNLDNNGRFVAIVKLSLLGQLFLFIADIDIDFCLELFPRNKSSFFGIWQNTDIHIIIEKIYEFFSSHLQARTFEKKTKSIGFSHKSEYVRFMILSEMTIAEKVDAIYKKVVANAK